MKIQIEDVTIYFPYEKIYPEQLKYIKTLLKSLQSPGHVLIEMPSGTGKTVALLSCTVSYQLHLKSKGVPFKIIYCSRTIPEIDKALKELRNLVEYISKYVVFNFLGVGLSKRGNMCINKAALESFDVEVMCRKMINRFENLKCDFYENKATSIPYGVYDFAEIKELGAKMGVCPYFFVREHLPLFDCIIYPYNYLIDPSIYSIISKELPRDSFVIFDEAHNIDSHCIEALSVDITRNTLEAASRIMKSIEAKLKTKRQDIDSELKKGYEMMFKAVEYTGENVIPHSFNTNKAELAPGNLRNANHFISVMKRLIEFFKTKLRTTHLTVESIRSFLKSIEDLTLVDKKTLSFTSQRLGILIRSLDIDDNDIHKLLSVANFGTMLSIYSKGFSVIFEPYDTMSGVFNPILRLYCVDPSIGMSHVFKNFRNVIITSGTLSPIEMYPKILCFAPSNITEISITLSRNAISPLIVTKGSDQMLLKNTKDDLYETLDIEDKNYDKVTTSFTARTDPSVVRNYGNLVISLCKIVPDNMVVFFPSYIYMEEIITLWSESSVMGEILENKLVFVETPDFRETTIALANYRKACDMGRGAVLFSVARGKVSEGVDFEHGYGRAVVMLGVPFMYTESVRLKERLKYMKDEYGIKEYEFLVFDAMRHTAQCLGRVLRNKTDYGLMVMADQRFSAPGKIGKMPKWIQERLERGNTGLSIDMALSVARMFYKEMAQPDRGDGVSLLNEAETSVYLRKI